jgi:hypothetical protein
MANYLIIGGDQKEYGPITAEEVCKWIAEGRLNAQSRAKAESDAEFRPLSAFPEFAAALAAPAAPPPPLTALGAGADDGRAAALRLVKGPVIGLKVTAIVGLVLVAIGLVINILTLCGTPIGMQQINDPQVQKLFNSLGGGLGIVQNIIGAIVGVIVLIGAAKMQQLQNFQLALTASIVAMIPCISPCCVFGLPFGIWALVVLNKPEVKSQFGG